MADSGVPGCTVAGTNTRVQRTTAYHAHTRARALDPLPTGTTNTHTHRHQTPGNNERSEIRPDINCAHRVWRCYGYGCCGRRCIRAGEGTGRATGLHRSFDAICTIYDTGTSVVDLILPPLSVLSIPSQRRSRRKTRKNIHFSFCKVIFYDIL